MTITRRGFLAAVAGGAVTLSLGPPRGVRAAVQATPVVTSEQAETARLWRRIEEEFTALTERTRERRAYTVRLSAWIESGGDGTWRVGPATVLPAQGVDA